MEGRIKGARIRETWLRDRISALAMSLGYAQTLELAGIVGRVHLAMSFVRTGHRFLTEAVSFGVRWTPVSEMVVDLLASPLPLHRVTQVGVFSDDVLRISLCEYQVAFRNPAPDSLWREVVRLPPEEDWTLILEKLSSILADVQGDLEENMWRIWQRKHA